MVRQGHTVCARMPNLHPSSVLRCLRHVLYNKSFFSQIGMRFLWFVLWCLFFSFSCREGHEPPAMPSAGSQRGAAASPRRPKLVPVGSAAPAAGARRCAAAGLGASGEVSACAAECLIQQQNPRAASKPSWKNHLQASRLGGNIQCWMRLPDRPVCRAACGSPGTGRPPKASPRASRAPRCLKT